MKRTIILILLLAVLCCGCGREPAPVPTAATEPTQAQTIPTQPPTEPAAPTEPDPTAIPVETPCGTLYLPDDWDIPITVTERKGDPLVLAFTAEETALYDLTFSAGASQAMGQKQTADGIIYVGLQIHELEEATDMLLAMQETVNSLLVQLALEPVAPGAGETRTEIRLDTAYGQLLYPAKWQDLLKTEQPEDRLLEFRCCLPGKDPQLLFTVLFGIGTDGPSAAITAPDGTRTEVYILVAEPEFDSSWTREETDTYYAMQEDMNYLLDALRSAQ